MAESKAAPQPRADDQQTQAVEYLTLAFHHSATWHFLKEQAAHRLAELSTGLPPDVVATAQTRGKTKRWMK